MCDDDPADFRFWGWATSHTDAVAAAVAATLPLPWATAVAGTALRRAQPGPRPRVPWLDALAVAVQAVLVALQPPLGLRLAVFAAHTVAVCSAQTLAPWAPLAAPAAALVAAFLTERPCTAPWLAAVDAVAGLYAAWRWSRGRRRRLVALGCYAEAAAVLVFFFYEGQLRSKESHLTWWGLTGLATWAVTHGVDACWGTTACRRVLSPPLGAMQLAIAYGTMGLSAFKCQLLQDAYDDNGAAAYAAGNFVMHYYPIVRRAASAPRQRCTPAWAARASVGAFIVAVYATSVDAATVYGCSPALSPAAASVLTVVLGLLGALTSAVATYAADIFIGYNKL